MKTRVFGGKDDAKFWSDKPIQYGHPKYKRPFWHIHRYNITTHPVHKSADGSIVDVMGSIMLKKCKCGKVKR